MKKTILLAPLFVGMLGILSCKKEEVDTKPPQIEIFTPKDGDTISYGTNIPLHLKIQDESAVQVIGYRLYPDSELGRKISLTHNLELALIFVEFEDIIRLKIPKKINDSVYYNDDHYDLQVLARDFKGNIARKDLRLYIMNDTL